MSGNQAVESPVRVSAAGLRTVRIALAGCGTVGGELVRLVHERSASIQRRHGVHLEFTSILVRDAGRPRSASVRTDLLTEDVDAFLSADADVIVEAIGGLDPAHRIASAALSTGRTFVTANKALLADCGPDLAALARTGGGRVLFEAAVAGGVPVIRVLRDALAETGVRAIRGILNGTSNFILTRMSEGIAYADALREARALGYAEADPSRDLDGRDAADKIAVLAWIAFGTDPRSISIARRGLLPNPDRLVSDAASAGGVLRLVAECIHTRNGVLASVEPVVLPSGSKLARTHGPENTIEIETQHNGVIHLAGPGAGGAATASALLSDLIASAQPLVEDGPPARALPDTRAFSWLISVPREHRGALALDRVLRAAGIDSAHAFEDSDAGAAIIITAPCSRARIASIERNLSSIGRSAMVARYGMSHPLASAPGAPMLAPMQTA